MLPFKMKFYPDELYYSWLARYHKRSGNAYPKDTSIQVIGKEIRQGTRVDRLFCLDEFCKNTGFDANDIIQNHSVFPYFRLGWSEAVIRENIEMARKSDITFKPRYGSRESVTFRYCPLCAQEDIEKYGVAYRHVSHQYEGVEVCPQHHVHLIRQMKSTGQFAFNSRLPNYTMIDPVIVETDPQEIAFADLVARASKEETYTRNQIIPLVREKAKEMAGGKNYKAMLEELCNDESICRMYERRKISLDTPPYRRLHICINDPNGCSHPFYFYILRLVTGLTVEEASRIEEKLKNTK